MPDSLEHRGNAVVTGHLAEIKFVKTRSVCVLCVEVPIEKAEEAIQRIGIPLPGQEIPVALARLVVPAEGEPPREARVEQDSARGTNDKSPARSEAGKLAFAMKPKMEKAAAMAGMLRKDDRYRRYLERITGVSIRGETEIAAAQRAELGVRSCSEISSEQEAYERFLIHEHAFKEWAGLVAERR